MRQVPAVCARLVSWRVVVDDEPTHLAGERRGPAQAGAEPFDDGTTLRGVVAAMALPDVVEQSRQPQVLFLLLAKI